MGLDVFVFAPDGETKLIHRRIGNISYVACLRKDLAVLLDPKSSIIYQKIIYSGSHAGDELPVTEFPQLERELKQIKEAHIASKWVPEFVEVFHEVLKVAKENNQPIVF